MENVRFWKRAYWICFAIYWIAYFLPSFGKTLNSSDVMPGFMCAYFSFVMFFSVIGFFGNFANLSAILNFIFVLNARPQSGMAPAIISLVMSIIGTLTWLVFWDGLMIGYWLWTLATIGMAVSHLFYRSALRVIADKEEKDLSEHLLDNR